MKRRMEVGRWGFSPPLFATRDHLVPRAVQSKAGGVAAKAYFSRGFAE